MSARDAIADWIKIGSILDREAHLRRADHILAALYAAGYKVMPREPTDAVVRAGWGRVSAANYRAYRTMWDATPAILARARELDPQ
jgi:hypothetical protein